MFPSWLSPPIFFLPSLYDGCIDASPADSSPATLAIDVDNELPRLALLLALLTTISPEGSSSSFSSSNLCLDFHSFLPLDSFFLRLPHHLHAGIFLLIPFLISLTFATFRFLTFLPSPSRGVFYSVFAIVSSSFPSLLLGRLIFPRFFEGTLR